MVRTLRCSACFATSAFPRASTSAVLLQFASEFPLKDKRRDRKVRRGPQRGIQKGLRNSSVAKQLRVNPEVVSRPSLKGGTDPALRHSTFLVRCSTFHFLTVPSVSSSRRRESLAPQRRTRDCRGPSHVASSDRRDSTAIKRSSGRNDRCEFAG